MKTEDEIRRTIKSRLKEIRGKGKGKGKETQEAFAKRILGDDTRNRWANWESTSPKNISRLPQLEDFALICENADVSADYLLGRTQIKNDTRLISNMLNLSEDSIALLKENSSKNPYFTINEFVDYLLTSSKVLDLIEKIDRIWVHNCTTEACETLFTKPVIEKADDIFFKYKEKSGIWDTTCEKYSEMLSDAFQKDEAFNVNSEELQMYLQNLCPDYASISESEQYQLKIKELATLRFDFHLRKEQYEILKYQIAENFKLIAEQYIEFRTNNFLNRKFKSL